MNPTIRTATLDDVPALLELEQKAFDPTYYYLTSRRQFRYLLTKGNADILAAVENDKLYGSGILLYRRNSGFARFYSLSVSPDYQGGSIGKILFQAAEQKALARNCIGMLLEIRSDNTKLLQRYQSLGYSVYREVSHYYPDGCSCLKLKKTF
jgi:ribosomal protein S18 acetylase RimI-like enzyme